MHFFRFYQLYVVSAQAAITQSPSTYVQKLQVSEVVDETISRSCVSSYHVLARSYVQTRGGSCLLVPRRLNFFETQINVMRNCVKRKKKYDRKSRTNLLLLLCAYVPPISTPYKINTPEPIDKKLGTVDYAREGTSYTKFGTNPPTEGFWANG